jgi:uncharacterized protein YdiU (UPF0061 family)
MSCPITEDKTSKLSGIEALAQLADYSLVNNLEADPQATETGEDYQPRQVFSGHYVPVKPTPLADPEYIAHSDTFFKELGWADDLAHTDAFLNMFSGNLSEVPAPMRKIGWATGYALSIYGREYTQQCPFGTGNGYGDGRAVSVFEAVIHGKRWEMQLKGGGRTPYCRGADGRAVLRSSVREFLAQEHMYALGVPTSRSLSLCVSKSERVNRPWYTEGSWSTEPDIMLPNPVAICTRVAPSFLRVGQLELFARRARNQAYPEALKELEMIVLHLIEREYKDQIGSDLPLPEQLILLATAFRHRLTSLITDWLRVGYCQGNFNGDNCAGGGYTLDYGPFGFCERFDPAFQPWTGGGRHFSFFNQPEAAKANFNMFCKSLEPLLVSYPVASEQLNEIKQGFAPMMQQKMENMWADKLGLEQFDSELFSQLLQLMMQTSVDHTIFFRELCALPKDVAGFSKSFYQIPSDSLNQQWSAWLQSWHDALAKQQDVTSISIKMKQINPKYTWREWLVVPAYQRAAEGDYSLVHELHSVLNQPYAEQSKDVEDKYYQLRPEAFATAGGISHYSCSS